MTSESRTISKRASAIAWGFAAGRVLAPIPSKILMVLARRVNGKRGDFDVWPDQALIAEDANLSVSTVQRHLKALEKQGYFTKRMREAPGRGFTGWVYTLNVKATFEMPDGHVEKEDFYAAADVHRPVSRDVHRQVTADVSNTELGKEELGKEEHPLNPQGDESDLFGGGLVIPDLIDQEIGDAYVERWNRLCDEEDRLESASRFSADRQKELVTRLGTRDPAQVGILLDELFRRISRSRVLRGRGRGMDWRPGWSWPLKKMNFNKIMDGFYAEDFDSDNPDRGANGGERSHVQAGRDVLGAIERMYGES